MTTVIAPTRHGVLPRVNLLPPEIAQRARFDRQRYALVGALALTVVGMVGAYVVASQSAGRAEADLGTVRADGLAITQETAQYADIPRVEAQTRAAESQLQIAMGQEVRWSYFLNDVSVLMPSNVWLTNLTMTQPLAAAPGVAAVPLDPAVGRYATPGIAALTYAGTARTYADVATWLESQELIAHSDAPYLTTSADAKIGAVDVVGFTTTATVDSSALSGRYDTPAGQPR